MNGKFKVQTSLPKVIENWASAGLLKVRVYILMSRVSRFDNFHHSLIYHGVYYIALQDVALQLNNLSASQQKRALNFYTNHQNPQNHNIRHYVCD